MNISAIKKARTLKAKKNANKSDKSGKGREFIAKLSKGLMLPIAMLPIAGLFLGIGAAIATAGTNAGNLGLITFGNFLKMPGDVIFGALPVLFAIAIAIAFTKDAGPAALAALVGFLVFAGIQQALIVEVKGFVLPNGESKFVGYDLLFYKGGALGKYSPSQNLWVNHDNEFVKTSVNAGLSSALFGKVLGINQLSTSVFGGFLVGFTVAYLYNKFKNIQLPSAIGFFSGIRFIPIAVFFAFFPITIAVLIIWPLIGILFQILGGALGSGMLGFNSFIFGYIERALVPFGLHHAFYSPLWYTNVGGSLELAQNATILVNGAQEQISSIKIANSTKEITNWTSLFTTLNPQFDKSLGAISGDQVLWANINNVAGTKVMLANGKEHVLSFSDFTSAAASKGVNVGQYMHGKYPFMMFGLPAAGAAMVMAAPKENRKMAASLIGSASATALLTGITEPLEFTFLFLAPWLFWGVHASLSALSFGLMNWVGLIVPSVAPHIGMTFSGGLIDWIVYGAIQIPAGSNAWWALVIGAAYVPIYYSLFYFLIKKYNISTPGRGGNVKLFSKKDYQNKDNGIDSEFDSLAIEIIKSYGGLENIKNVDACITKLRIQVTNQDAVDENRLKSELGAAGTIRPSKNSVYAIYGAKADYLKIKIIEIIKAVHKVPTLKDSLFANKDKSEIKHIEKVQEKQVKKEQKSSETFTIYAPVDCELVNLKKVPDETFSENILGQGIAIRALKTEFSSILKSGILESYFVTGHAYIFRTKKNSAILMHIGVNSANAKDEQNKLVKLFKPLIKQGESLTLDKAIVKIALKKLKTYAKSDLIPIIVLNETLANRSVELATTKTKVKKGEPILIIK